MSLTARTLNLNWEALLPRSCTGARRDRRAVTHVQTAWTWFKSLSWADVRGGQGWIKWIIRSTVHSTEYTDASRVFPATYTVPLLPLFALRLALTLTLTLARSCLTVEATNAAPPPWPTTFHTRRRRRASPKEATRASFPGGIFLVHSRKTAPATPRRSGPPTKLCRFVSTQHPRRDEWRAWCRRLARGCVRIASNGAIQGRRMANGTPSAAFVSPCQRRPGLAPAV